MTDLDLDALLSEYDPLALLVEAAREHRAVRESAFVAARLEEHVAFDDASVDDDLRAATRVAFAAHAPEDGPRLYASDPWSLRVRPRPGGGWFFGLEGPGHATLTLGEHELALTPRRWTAWTGPLPVGELTLRDTYGVEVILTPKR